MGTLPYEGSAPHVGLIARRMNALRHIRTAPQTSWSLHSALMQRLLPVTTFTRTTRHSSCVARSSERPSPEGFKSRYHRVSVWKSQAS